MVQLTIFIDILDGHLKGFQSQYICERSSMLINECTLYASFYAPLYISYIIQDILVLLLRNLHPFLHPGHFGLCLMPIYYHAYAVLCISVNTIYLIIILGYVLYRFIDHAPHYGISGFDSRLGRVSCKLCKWTFFLLNSVLNYCKKKKEKKKERKRQGVGMVMYLLANAPLTIKTINIFTIHYDYRFAITRAYNKTFNGEKRKPHIHLIHNRMRQLVKSCHILLILLNQRKI